MICTAPWMCENDKPPQRPARPARLLLRALLQCRHLLIRSPLLPSPPRPQLACSFRGEDDRYYCYSNMSKAHAVWYAVQVNCR